MKKQSGSRRDFLRKLGLSTAAISVAPLAGAAAPEEKVKMLTPDGKLVEVAASVVRKAPKQKATSKDILDWRTLKG